LIRRLIILACGLALGAAIWFLFLRGGAPSGQRASSVAGGAAAQSEQPSAAPVVSPTSSAANMESATGSSQAAAPSTFPTTALPPVTPFLLGSADKPPPMEPATVLDNMRIAIQQYGSRFGGNPVGTNPEITRALNGENPKQVHFITEESGLRINGRGELVDYWGTPFFFHQLSATDMEIHSAGPDRIMWTADDLVSK
jgi:hypothetical protein